MKIAIHNKANDFSERWIKCCEAEGIHFKLVNCYSSSIINDLSDCHALMWHHNQADPRDLLFAKQLLFALESTGFPVFPDFKTGWFFDDKVAQKYLLEAAGLPLVPTYVFYDKNSALEWAESETFPKVFKLRGGAGSANVRLARSKKEAIQLIKQAFGRGFSNYDKWGSLKERWYKFRKGKGSFWNVIKGILRFGRTTEAARTSGKERGYVYFQDFIPENNFDIRIVVVAGRAFGIKRMVRDGDFRASGSGSVRYEKENFDDQTIKSAFLVAERTGSRCLAVDFVYLDDEPLIVELSYGFIKEVYDACEGYWTSDLKWHPRPFNPQGWMVEDLLNQAKNSEAVPNS